MDRFSPLSLLTQQFRGGQNVVRRLPMRRMSKVRGLIPSEHVIFTLEYPVRVSLNLMLQPTYHKRSLISVCVVMFKQVTLREKRFVATAQIFYRGGW